MINLKRIRIFCIFINTCVNGLVLVVKIPSKPRLFAKFITSSSRNFITATFSFVDKEQCVAIITECRTFPLPFGSFEFLKTHSIKKTEIEEFEITTLLEFPHNLKTPRLCSGPNQFLPQAHPMHPNLLLHPLLFPFHSWPRNSNLSGLAVQKMRQLILHNPLPRYDRLYTFPTQLCGRNLL